MFNEIIIYLYIVVLAAFVGYEVINRVPALLHTPLMSGTNFIHGIILIGALIALGQAKTLVEEILGFSAVFVATMNIVGGYVTTKRMLEMFNNSKQHK